MSRNPGWLARTGMLSSTRRRVNRSPSGTATRMSYCSRTSAAVSPRQTIDLLMGVRSWPSGSGRDRAFCVIDGIAVGPGLAAVRIIDDPLGRTVDAQHVEHGWSRVAEGMRHLGRQRHHVAGLEMDGIGFVPFLPDHAFPFEHE